MSISESLNLELSNAFMWKLKSAKQCFWIILLLLFCCNLILTSYHTFLFFDYYIYLYYIHVFIYNCRSTKGIRNCRIESFEGISLITKTLPEKNCFQLTKKSTSRTFRIFFFSEHELKMKNKIKAKPMSLLLLPHSSFSPFTFVYSCNWKYNRRRMKYYNEKKYVLGYYFDGKIQKRWISYIRICMINCWNEKYEISKHALKYLMLCFSNFEKE